LAVLRVAHAVRDEHRGPVAARREAAPHMLHAAHGRARADLPRPPRGHRRAAAATAARGGAAGLPDPSRDVGVDSSTFVHFRLKRGSVRAGARARGSLYGRRCPPNAASIRTTRISKLRGHAIGCAARRRNSSSSPPEPPPEDPPIESPVTASAPRKASRCRMKGGGDARGLVVSGDRALSICACEAAQLALGSPKSHGSTYAAAIRLICRSQWHAVAGSTGARLAAAVAAAEIAATVEKAVSILEVSRECPCVGAWGRRGM